jgi:poly(3-hydroxybutyrate) depolymerase
MSSIRSKCIRTLLCMLSAGAFLAASLAVAQPPGPPGAGGTPPFVEADDPRVENRTYHFEDTDEQMPYSVFVSSKVSDDQPNPLIVTLHGLGVGAGFMLRGAALDMAEDGGYILVGPMGYNAAGWYGSPVITFGTQEVDPPNLAELSETDVMNVLAMIREEFNVDESRIYLMGHSMGGAGTLYLGTKYADLWAALAPVAPASFMLQTSIMDPVRDTLAPMIIVHGDADTLVPPEQGRRWAEYMAEHGMTHEYVELEGVDHGAVIELSVPFIFEFFAEHARED